MWILPQELITEILFQLPVKFLLRFLCVSKSSSALICNPDFIKIQFEINKERTILVQAWSHDDDHKPLNLKHYLLNLSDENQPVEVFPPFNHPEDSRIIDCCNGLVCIHTSDDNETVIWNPFIRKYKKLPPEPTGRDLPSIYALPDFSFGYDRVNDDYKVLKTMQFFNSREKGEGDFEVDVYSLKAHSWRRVEDERPCKDSSIWAGPVYLNGAFHWLVKTTTGGIRLLAFHLTTEKFHQEDMLLPVELELVKKLDVWRGSLCVSAYGSEGKGIDYWMMEDGVWSRPYTVSQTFRYNMCWWRVPYLKEGRVVMFPTEGEKVLMEMDYGQKHLFWFDIKNMTLSLTLTHISNMFWTGTCGESLLLLDGDSIE
jgi:F-box interacting protein